METITIIRTVTLVIALLNLSLFLAGYSPLPIENEEIEQVLTAIFTIGASLWAWWKDNDISRKARKRKAEVKWSR
ncbi:phage holin [Jeotgalibacillus sp. S-D1]|uniref:phage holin n=1 Tax=Jeotgalibacillus sp. S-D1 TaxID=2552189 RepID=UPI001059747E|nr:phage holin [Jeotgalibacillus sp. S-D1]TDL34388.1 phage holin [Jeotgalibacillus sp. S-D1]